YRRKGQCPSRKTCISGGSINGLNTDKGEVGGSSPPRPTIQITSKYAAIRTFPLFGDLDQKTVLSTVCQLPDLPDGATLKAVKTVQVKAEGLASI
ncbi:MAG TPA: hypothetical protein VIX91_10725, partial [Candidatus Acidoferrum sp.]